jgi:hypothetical protein
MLTEVQIVGYVLYLCMFVCVGASDTTTALTIPSPVACVQAYDAQCCMPPPGYAERSHRAVARGRRGLGQCPKYAQRSGQRPEIFFWAVFCYF